MKSIVATRCFRICLLANLHRTFAQKQSEGVSVSFQIVVTRQIARYSRTKPYLCKTNQRSASRRCSILRCAKEYGLIAGTSLGWLPRAVIFCGLIAVDNSNVHFSTVGNRATTSNVSSSVKHIVSLYKDHPRHILHFI